MAKTESDIHTTLRAILAGMNIPNEQRSEIWDNLNKGSMDIGVFERNTECFMMIFYAMLEYVFMESYGTPTDYAAILLDCDKDSTPKPIKKPKTKRQEELEFRIMRELKRLVKDKMSPVFLVPQTMHFQYPLTPDYMMAEIIILKHEVYQLNKTVKNLKKRIYGTEE